VTFQETVLGDRYGVMLLFGPGSTSISAFMNRSKYYLQLHLAFDIYTNKFCTFSLSR